MPNPSLNLFAGPLKKLMSVLKVCLFVL